MTIIILVLIGLLIGFSIGFFICLMLRKIYSYSGIMKIIREDDKIVYSLELHEDPVMLEYKNEVVFKIETSDKSSNQSQVKLFV